VAGISFALPKKKPPFSKLREGLIQTDALTFLYLDNNGSN